MITVYFDGLYGCLSNHIIGIRILGMCYIDITQQTGGISPKKGDTHHSSP